ncbi:hypothetical protein ACIPY5_17865 [Microbacterium sp. NPDC089698]|uniref:hypothetical protein n=1 Tax=Microbacterium sp. NPDC089698 TaxID=3364200 RepID=UPI003823530D
MCRAVNCKTCEKTTWAGCGQHVSEVRRTVPAAQWCDGRHTQTEADAAAPAKAGLLSRIFGR